MVIFHGYVSHNQRVGLLHPRNDFFLKIDEDLQDGSQICQEKHVRPGRSTQRQCYLWRRNLKSLGGVTHRCYPLVNVYITMERLTIFNG